MNRRGLFGSICVLPFLSIFKKKFEYRDKHLGKVKEFKVEEDLTLNSNYLWFPVEAIVCVKY